MVLSIVGMLLVANTLNIAADLAAMAEALRLLFGGSTHVYAVTFGLVSHVLQVFLPYERYVRWLKWLTLVLLAYVAVIFSLELDWWQVFRSLVRPALPAGRTRTRWCCVVAVFGTTIHSTCSSGRPRRRWRTPMGMCRAPLRRSVGTCAASSSTRSPA